MSVPVLVIFQNQRTTCSNCFCFKLNTRIIAPGYFQNPKELIAFMKQPVKYIQFCGHLFDFFQKKLGPMVKC